MKVQQLNNFLQQIFNLESIKVEIILLMVLMVNLLKK